MDQQPPTQHATRVLDMTVYLDDTAMSVLNQAHALAIFRNEDVLPTAQAISHLANEPIIRVYALAEALQYHLTSSLEPAPPHRYRALPQALADLEADERPAPLLDRLRQVMAEVERAAQEGSPRHGES